MFHTDMCVEMPLFSLERSVSIRIHTANLIIRNQIKVTPYCTSFLLSISMFHPGDCQDKYKHTTYQTEHFFLTCCFDLRCLIFIFGVTFSGISHSLIILCQTPVLYAMVGSSCGTLYLLTSVSSTSLSTSAS